MPTTEPAQTLDDCLISIEINLQALGWISIQRQGCRRTILLHEPRLVFWAVECLKRSGWDDARISSVLDAHPPERHWWLLRQLLPDEALLTLGAKLRGF